MRMGLGREGCALRFGAGEGGGLAGRRLVLGGSCWRGGAGAGGGASLSR